jgi:hypothetical protein
MSRSFIIRTVRLTRTLRVWVGFVVVLAACHPIRGCSDVEVVLSYYPAPIIGSERMAKVTLRAKNGRILQEVIATLRGREPLTLEPHAGAGPIPYPSYEVLTADGVVDLIEHRRQEPIFYVSDDPDVRQKLGVE